MNTRSRVLVVAAIGVWLAYPGRAVAHRLDEYLQATRVAIDLDHVGLKIDLTPGVSVAPAILASIDANGDDRISAAEGAAYARAMIGSVSLRVDGRLEPVVLVGHEFPDVRDVRLGQGTIRLRARAILSSTSAGRHQVSYLNAHRPEASVYLVNALMPEDSRIHIVGLQRDQSQHGLTVSYRVKAWTRGWLLSGLAMVGVLLIARRPRTVRRP